MSFAAGRWACEPYSIASADAVARALGVAPAVGQVLVRRGHTTPEAARAFLAAADRHDPGLLGDMDAACERTLRQVADGGRIVVHGDYDVDGVTSTAILVGALRDLGADPSWHIPDRADGYGLSRATVERLAAAGTRLLLTVDCGITCAPEVAHARTLGMDVVVTDHHRPADELPDCPIIHPGLGRYPFAGLCAAGVAHKLSAGLRARAGVDPATADRELDLVALATICDMVPLLGENRRLVREGLVALARTRRPGLRALMRIASLEPSDVDERAVGFRLGPRLNAAGRLRRADAALELLMTDDERRAAEVADELDLLNRERRDVETRILFAAEAERAPQDGAPAYVVAGEGWHHGVVGIVASRLAERHHRPCVVIGIDAEGGRGSGRSIPAFDLHAALGDCAGHLRRFGGHRAAAGLEVDPERIDAFRRDFVACAAARLAPEDLAPVEEVDAVAPATALGLDLAEQLRALAPFGHRNPEPTLLVPAARTSDVRGMGDEGQHARFTLSSSGARAQAVAFRTTPAQLKRDGEELRDAAVRLELREWNGAVEPRLVLSAMCATRRGAVRPVAGDRPFLKAVERELEADLQPRTAQVAAGLAPMPTRIVRDRRGEGIAGVAGELLSSGESVLAVCADVARRRETLERLVAGLNRPEGREELAVASWDEVLADAEVVRPYAHLLALDPPFAADAIDSAEPASLGISAPAGPAVPDAPAGVTDAPARATDGPSPCFVHLAWGPAEAEFSLAVARAGLDLRLPLAEAYRALREAGESDGRALRAVLEGTGRHPRTPAVCGRLLRVLRELELVAYGRRGEEPWCRVLDAPRTDLDRSAAHRAYRARLEEAERYLAQEAARLRRPAAAPASGPTSAPQHSPARPGQAGALADSA